MRRRAQRPHGGPVRINTRSTQLSGLRDVFPGEYATATTFGKQPISYLGTFDTFGAVRPDPILGVFPQNNQAGANRDGLILPAPGGAWGSTTDPYTISLWAYENQAPGAPRGLFSMGTPSWSLSLGHSVSTPGAFRASVVTTSGGAAQFNTGETPVYPEFVWHHIAVVWNPPSGLFLYVNGTLQASNTTATTTLRDVSDMRVYGNTTDANGWDGSIADFRVYRRAFTAAEVWNLRADPWSLYALPRRVYAKVGAGGVSLSPGVYAAALTGQGVHLGFTINMPDEL